MINHPFPVGTLCLLVYTLGQRPHLVGHQCVVTKSLHPAGSKFLPGIKIGSPIYEVEIAGEPGFSVKKDQIIPIQPDSDDFDETETVEDELVTVS